MVSLNEDLLDFSSEDTMNGYPIEDHVINLSTRKITSVSINRAVKDVSIMYNALQSGYLGTGVAAKKQFMKMSNEFSNRNFQTYSLDLITTPRNGCGSKTITYTIKYTNLIHLDKDAYSLREILKLRIHDK